MLIVRYFQLYRIVDELLLGVEREKRKEILDYGYMTKVSIAGLKQKRANLIYLKAYDSNIREMYVSGQNIQNRKSKVAKENSWIGT